MSSSSLPPNFRKLPLEKRQELTQKLFSLSDQDAAIYCGKSDLNPLTDKMVEAAIGIYATPFGLATDFLIDGKEYILPMATEEPSVILAASYAAKIIKASGGFSTWADEPIVTAQIYLENTTRNAEVHLRSHETQIRAAVDALLPDMTRRGGGFRGLEMTPLSRLKTLTVSIHIDVRDAMGANVANTVAESLKPLVEKLSGGRALMAVLTNASLHRKAGASFKVPEKYLAKGNISGKEAAEKIVKAQLLAEEFPERAVTHNKGVMNGLSALALATGNDTRAIEAAAHFFAQVEGRYKPLTRYRLENGVLKGSIQLPLAMGTVGGATSHWPPAKLSLDILGRPDAETLARIAVSLALSQNLAALFALVTEGIQKGHMKLHARRSGG